MQAAAHLHHVGPVQAVDAVDAQRAALAAALSCATGLEAAKPLDVAADLRPQLLQPAPLLFSISQASSDAMLTQQTAIQRPRLS